jgi:DNA-binding winged helix-turn-helix (wHTH) protein
MENQGSVAIPETILHHTVLSDRTPVRAIFGDFILDVGRRELSRGEAALHVSRKALQLLELILRAAPDAVSKEQAYKHLWGDVFVEETNIANLISEIRNALGDDSRNPRLIRTLYRFGYRFDGKVEWDNVEKEEHASHGVRAWLVWSSREFSLTPGENVIGRDPQVKVPIDSAAISRRHARLTVGEHVIVEDLGSKNGTFVRGERITAAVEIQDGDTVGFGSVLVLFRMLLDTGTTLTEMRPLT